MAATVPEQEQIPSDWIKDFFFTWINRFSFFLAHHPPRPILPLYLVSFGASSTVIGAVMAVFTITATITRIPVGLLIDRIGRKPFLIAGVALFAAGNFGYMWAPSILLMLPFRMLHGIGWSGCTTAVATLAPEFPPRNGAAGLSGFAPLPSAL